MRRILTVAALPLLAVLAIGCESHSRVDSIHRMNDGIVQLKKGNLSGAEKAMQESIKIDPTHAQAHFNIGKLYRKQEKWVDAQKSFEAAIAAMGEAPDANYHYELGYTILAQAEQPENSIETRNGKYREAAKAFEAGVAANPRLYKAQYHLGYIHEKLDEPEQADANYRGCIQSNAKYSLCFVSLGNMYIDYGFSNVAMSVLNTGAQVNDTDAAMWNGLGRAQLALNKPVEAVDAYLKAKAIDPDMPDVLFGLGMAYSEMRKKKEASEHLELFLKKAGNAVPEHLRKAANDELARMQDVI